MSVAQEWIERELGRISYHILDKHLPTDFLPSLAEQKAFLTLQTICDVLNDQNMSDFDCVEEIVCILEKAGLSVSRHDFG